MGARRKKGYDMEKTIIMVIKHKKKKIERLSTEHGLKTRVKELKAFTITFDAKR
jgi:hypothetical protein